MGDFVIHNQPACWINLLIINVAVSIQIQKACQDCKCRIINAIPLSWLSYRS
jgi:hypothetical protein